MTARGPNLVMPGHHKEALIKGKAMLEVEIDTARWEFSKRIAELYPSGLRLLYTRSSTQKKPSLLEVQSVDGNGMILCRYVNTSVQSLIRLTLERMVKADVVC